MFYFIRLAAWCVEKSTLTKHYKKHESWATLNSHYLKSCGMVTGVSLLRVQRNSHGSFYNFLHIVISGSQQHLFTQIPNIYSVKEKYHTILSSALFLSLLWVVLPRIGVYSFLNPQLLTLTRSIWNLLFWRNSSCITMLKQCFIFILIFWKRRVLLRKPFTLWLIIRNLKRPTLTLRPNTKWLGVPLYPYPCSNFWPITTWSTRFTTSDVLEISAFTHIIDTM